MKKIKLWMLAAILTFCGTTTLTSCSDYEEDNTPVVNPDQPVVLNCAKPDYLKVGDKVALISPSYFTPMENVEKTADVLRSWGLEPVIGPNVGKVVDGRYAGTVAERVSDIRWALRDPTVNASNRLPEGIYSPSGVRRQQLQRGLNIVVGADGRVKKVMSSAGR